MDKSDPVHQAIKAVLSELGMPGLPCRSTTVLIWEGRCVGQRLIFDAVEAVWLTVENVVHVYDEDGRLPKSVELGKRKAA